MASSDTIEGRIGAGLKYTRLIITIKLLLQVCWENPNLAELMCRRFGIWNMDYESFWPVPSFFVHAINMNNALSISLFCTECSELFSPTIKELSDWTVENSSNNFCQVARDHIKLRVTYHIDVHSSGYNFNSRV